jgi:hypothetical protein
VRGGGPGHIRNAYFAVALCSHRVRSMRAETMLVVYQRGCVEVRDTSQCVAFESTLYVESLTLRTHAFASRRWWTFCGLRVIVRV